MIYNIYFLDITKQDETTYLGNILFYLELLMSIIYILYTLGSILTMKNSDSTRVHVMILIVTVLSWSIHILFMYLVAIDFFVWLMLLLFLRIIAEFNKFKNLYISMLLYILMPYIVCIIMAQFVCVDSAVLLKLSH